MRDVPRFGTSGMSFGPLSNTANGLSEHKTTHALHNHWRVMDNWYSWNNNNNMPTSKLPLEQRSSAPSGLEFFLCYAKLFPRERVAMYISCDCTPTPINYVPPIALFSSLLAMTETSGIVCCEFVKTDKS